MGGGILAIWRDFTLSFLRNKKTDFFMRPVFCYFEDLLSFDEDLLSSDFTLELFEIEDLEDGH